MQSKKGFGLTGSWLGSLGDGPNHYSELVADFVDIGGTVMGGWQEKRVGNQTDHFQSKLSGKFRGGAV